MAFADLELSMQLRVASCPSEEQVGTNFVYVSPTTFASLGSIFADPSQLKLLKIYDLIYNVQETEDVPDEYVGLNIVQRSNVSAELGDLVEVVPLDPVLAIPELYEASFSVTSVTAGFHFQVSHLEEELESAHLIKQIQDRILGQVLTLNQELLILVDGHSLNVLVTKSNSNADLFSLAFCMGRHERLGSGSAVQHLDSKLMPTIASMAWGELGPFPELCGAVTAQVFPCAAASRGPDLTQRAFADEAVPLLLQTK
eukprot:17267-Rhodomonas_salina.1